MKKKLLLLFTILAIGLSNVWAYDFSAVAPSGQTLYYNISGNTVTVTNGDVNPVGSVVIPESVTYLGVTYPVTAIGYNAFVYGDNLTSVTLPNSVTFIDNFAFGACFNLRSIYIGCSVSSIAPYAFNRSGVDTLFYNARSLNNPEAFRIISLTYVEIGDSVQSLPSGAFQSQYDLTDVVMHDHLSVIGEYAFRGCRNLIDITIPNSVTSIGIGAFENCSALTNIVFPDSLVTISANAFKQCTGLTRVSIPNTVTAIGSSAFEGCTGLTSIAIPNGTIGSFAFCNCAGLTSVSIGCSVTSIEGRTFSDCNNVDTLFYNARNLNDQSPSWPCFRPLNLTCLIIGDSVQTIPQYAFYGQQRLVIVEIPDGITSIGDYAFSDCRGLTSAIIPNSVTYLGTRAFENCSSLTNITISNSVDTIKEHTFGDCSSLTKVVIPDSVTTICSWAFYNCAGLTSVSIGCSVTSIGDRAFSGCNNVDTLFYNARNLNDQTPSWPCFGPFNLTCLIIGDSVQTIPQYVFYGQRGLTHVVIPNSVLIIGDGSFEDCRGLCSVVISNSLITIGSNAFEDCSQLTSIVLPNTLTSIGHKAFYKCSGLTDIVIPNSVISIGSEAFSICTGLTSVTIGMSVSSIGYATFYGCSNVTTLYYNARSINAISDDSYCGFKPMNLANLIIGDSVQTIPQNAFDGQSRLSNITIPNSVSIIGDNAFRYCTNVDTLYYNARNMSALSSSSLGFRQMPLNYLRIGNNVQTLPNYVFYGQGGLTNVHIPDSVISIGDYAFYGCRNLDSVTIGESMISIGENAISKANVILSISTTPPSLNSNSLSNVSKSIVPCASVDLYQQAGWPNVVASEGYIYSVTTEDTIEGIVNIDSIPTCPAQTMVFSATPNPGFYFVQWNDGDTNNPRIVTLTQDTSYIAQFDHIHYTIAGISSDTSMGTVNGSTTETYMTNVTLTAVAKPGCRFIQWNDGSLENPRIVIADSNKNYTAQFDYIQYTITLLQNDSAMGHVDGAGIFQCGSQRTIYAIAASGHHFDQWSDGETLNPRTCTLTCDTVFVATFAKNRYVINTDVNDDTTGFVIGQGSYYYGDSIILRAIPASHCRFLYWSDGSTLNPRPLVVREDVSLTAYFSTMDISTAVDTIIITDTIITYNYIHDTIVVNNFIYDTTIVTQWQYDTTYVNVYVPVHDTTIINNYIHDTTTITQWQYDTTYVNVYIPVHDTTIIDNYIHDTTTVTQWQYDTTYVNVYVPVHDTTIINNFIHDTTIVDNYIHDTSYVNVYIHDTSYVDVYIHDTTFVELLVHDTLTITEELNWYVLNVVSGNASRGMVAGNGRFPENTEVEIAAIPIAGSRFVQWQDGNTENPRRVSVEGDMSFVATFDVAEVGVTDVESAQHIIFSNRGQIVVENAAGAQVRIFDNLGRCISTTRSMDDTRIFNMPASGVYMVQVGNDPAQKVVVVK